MARLSRAEVIDPNEVSVVHVINRTIRRCFLLGEDPISGKNFDHRKVWIETLLEQFAAQFGIDQSFKASHPGSGMSFDSRIVLSWTNNRCFPTK